MKVLQLIDSLEAGGAERVAVNYANGLLNHVEGSYLCATRGEGLLKSSLKKEVGYLFLKKEATIDFKAIKTLNRFVKNNQITVIHAHSSSYFLASIIKFLNPKLKLVWHDHYGKSEFLNERPKRVLKLCSRFFNHVFSVNSKLEIWATKNLKVKSVIYLPNYAVKNNQQLITKLKGEDGKRIVCLANLRPQKDHFTLIKAFKKASLNVSNWTLHLVGKDFKDEYSNQIKDLIFKENLVDKVIIYGSCSDTFAILKACDIGVLSSKSEGLPLGLLEYGLANLPVIATNVGQCNEVVKHENTGLLIDADDYINFSNALISYMKSTSLRDKYASALTLYVSDHFSEKSILKSIVKTYKQL